MYHLDWFMKEEEKRKNRMTSNDVSMINRDLQRIMHQLVDDIDQEKYQKEANQAGRILVQSTIWNIGYMNNMENADVALAQGLFMAFILKQENTEKKDYYDREIDIQMRRLGNVDWGMFLEYGRLKGKAPYRR